MSEISAEEALLKAKEIAARLTGAGGGGSTTIIEAPSNPAISTQASDVATSTARTERKRKRWGSAPATTSANNTAEGDAHNDVNNLSYLYDASLNISIFLMFCICVLLCKKFMDLSRELNELRETPIVDTFIEKAASAASSVAASAAASEEL